MSDDDNIDLEKLLEQKAKLEGMIQDNFTKVVTVVFTDLKGSTSIADREGDMASRMLIKEHNNIVFPIIENTFGVLVKSMGDGTLSYFEEAQNAVRAGAAIQMAFVEYNKKSMRKEPVHIRVGMHTGSVFLEEHDIFGDVVNTASRFESSANPGDIQLSESTYNALSDKEEIMVRYDREAQLKGKEGSFKVYKAYWKPEDYERDQQEKVKSEQIETQKKESEQMQAMQQQAASATASQGMQASEESKFIKQAQTFKNSNEMIHLFGYCSEKEQISTLSDMKQALIDSLDISAPNNIRFFNKEALWFYKTAIIFGRLQDADLPLTNLAISRAPIQIGIKNGEGFLQVMAQGGEKVNLIEIDKDGLKTTVAPNKEYLLGKSGRVVLSMCFPVEYKVFKNRFLVLKFLAKEDCVRAQMNLELNQVWANYQTEASKQIVIGS
jgi:class 3 adenylate cyclase